MRRPSCDIIEAAERAFGVRHGDVASPSRIGDVVRARFAAIRLLRCERRLSYPRIGRLLNRDHSTIIHGMARAEELLDSDPDFAEDYTEAAHIEKRP